MKMSRRRVHAIFTKELREYRHNGFIISTMAIIPLVFILPPLIQIFLVPPGASTVISKGGDLLLYLIGIPALVPASVAAYTIVGERQQGTLEPLLTTPIRREEILLGKTLACLVPSLIISYAVYFLNLAIVELFAQPGIASALIKWPEIVVQVVFTPLVAFWSIWVGTTISAKVSDFRVAQQFGTLAGLPIVAMVAVVAYDVIAPTLRLAVIAGVVLIVADRIGWRVMALSFDRERLITSTK
jgi:ABC-type transport system involved in multi-copper enzyme maturation permease subunit